MPTVNVYPRVVMLVMMRRGIHQKSNCSLLTPDMAYLRVQRNVSSTFRAYLAPRCVESHHQQCRTSRDQHLELEIHSPQLFRRLGFSV